MNEFIWIGLAITLILVSAIFLYTWTYRDAKNKGLNAKLWTLIVIFGPNGIGLLIYLLVARKQNFVKCINCNNIISLDSKYCSKCGNLMTEVKEIEKKPTKHLIIGFITSFIVAILCFGGLIFASETLEFKSGTSLFLTEFNTKNKWSISYYKSTSEFSKTIEKENNKPSTLYVEAESEVGNLSLKITQGNKKEVIDIKDTNGVKKIDLSKFENGEIKLLLINKQCENVSFEAHWE